MGHDAQSSPVTTAWESPSVTTWVQWTVAKVSATLYADQQMLERHEAQNTPPASVERPNTTAAVSLSCHKVESRLRAELEDLTMAVDLQQVYTKIKCRVAAFNALHSVFL